MVQNASKTYASGLLEILRIFSLLPFLFLSYSYADVISLEESEAHDRLVKYPNVWDRSDQYCEKLKVGSICNIPGSSLAGGGQGHCKRSVVKNSNYVDLKCEVDLPIYVPRNYPDGPFQLMNRKCDKEEAGVWTCDVPALVRDQFCSDKQVGESCSVTYTIKGGSKNTEKGVCSLESEIREGYWHGRITLSRPVLNCKAVEPLPSLEMRSVSILKKLFSW